MSDPAVCASDIRIRRGPRTVASSCVFVCPTYDEIGAHIVAVRTCFKATARLSWRCSNAGYCHDRKSSRSLKVDGIGVIQERGREGIRRSGPRIQMTGPIIALTKVMIAEVERIGGCS